MIYDYAKPKELMDEVMEQLNRVGKDLLDRYHDEVELIHMIMWRYNGEEAGYYNKQT